jgi:putative membrane-bound dehydrogenase-like protein
MSHSRTRLSLPSRLIFFAHLLLYSLTNSLAAEEITTNTAPPTNTPPARITNALSGFRIKQGFRVELVADENLAAAPAAMAFDENGRLFVAEMRDYPQGRDQSPHLGRIRLLEDTDGDGVFDTSTIFADNLPLPSALACYDGGILVAATPDILYFKDLNGDGVADERKTVFSGFGNESSGLKSDFLLNNFTWGLDNRIHAGAAGIGGLVIERDGKGAEPVTLRRNDFSFDPRALTLELEAGSAQSGLAYDNRGRKFFCDFTHPLRQALFEPRYFSRNPFFPPPPDASDSADPMASIFRLGSAAAATSSTARKTTPTSAFPSAVPFTRARGCVVYRGNAFSSNYVGNVFVADSEAHCIHRLALRENGIEVTAERPADEPGTEFLLSTDPAFRPAQIVNSPDGVLYIADFRDGGESGRILRIVPNNFKQPKLPQLGKAKTYDLAATLAHLNGWHRDTAARLLFERRDSTTAGLLTNMVNNARNSQARLQALAALDSLGGLTEAVLLKGLRDSDPAVRERAVLLTEKLAPDGLIADSLWNQLRFMADDYSPSVRYQLALTLGQVRHEGRPQLLAQMLQRAGGDSRMQAAVFSSLNEGAGECFVALANDGSTRNNPAGLGLLRRMAIMVGTQGGLEEVTQVVDWLDRNAADGRQANTYILAAGLGEGLRRAGSSLSLADPKHRLERIYSQAVAASVDYNVSEPLRLEAIRLLGVGSYSLTDAGDWFLLLIDANQSQAIQSTTLNTLGSYSDPRIVTSLLARWPAFSPAIRKQAVSALLSRADRLDTLLAAIESGRIQPEELNSTEVNLLRTHSDQAIRQRALRLFGPLTPQRPAALESFRPALRFAGDAVNGRQQYQSRCVSCHGTGGRGRTFGPDVAEMRALSREKLLSGIIQPSAEVQPQYLTYVIETRTGRIRVGLIIEQDPKTIVLKTEDGNELVLPRSNIQSVQPQPWSLMPEGLEQGLSPNTMTDLIFYISSPSR